jgi:hypothetical protein
VGGKIKQEDKTEEHRHAWLEGGSTAPPHERLGTLASAFVVGPS